MRGNPRLTPHLVIGLTFLAVGGLLTLDSLGIVDAGTVFDYWPALLVVVGVVKLVQSEYGRGRVAGLLLTSLGVLLLLRNLHVVSFRMREVWPLVLVVLGAALVFRAFERDGAAVGTSSTSTVNALAIMSGVHRSSSSQDFRGGELTAIMGGCEVDLREAAITSGPAVIHTFAFWGGIEIRVPETWSVSVEAIPFMGGFEDKSRPPRGGSTQQLIIRGFAIMGGVEVRN